MAETISSEYYRAEIAALNDEIKDLSERLEKSTQPKIHDKYDPFDNPTEYKGFSGDYSVIEPRITEPGYKIPLTPDYEERSSLTHWYGWGATCVLLRTLLALAVTFILTFAAYAAIKLVSPDISKEVRRSYIENSSILVGINSITLTVINVITSVIGMKRAGIRLSSVLRTRDLGANSIFQYCLIGSGIWYVSTCAVKGLAVLLRSVGMSIAFSTVDQYISRGLNLAVFAMYTCLLAPITEELFFRGMLLRVFSKASQRFAVYASALFFGLMHGNLPQFILAFLMGLFLGHITLKHGSIIPAAGVHIFVNSLSLMSEILRRQLRGTDFAVEMVLIVFAVVGLLLLVILRISDRIPRTTPEQHCRGTSTAAGSVMFVITVTVLLLRIIYALFRQSI